MTSLGYVAQVAFTQNCTEFTEGRFVRPQMGPVTKHACQDTPKMHEEVDSSAREAQEPRPGGPASNTIQINVQSLVKAAFVAKWLMRSFRSLRNERERSCVRLTAKASLFPA